MATIQSTIELFDNFSAPMMDIVQSVNQGMYAMENLQQTMGSSMDTSPIYEAQDALEQATVAAQGFEDAVNAGSTSRIYSQVSQTTAGLDDNINANTVAQDIFNQSVQNGTSAVDSLQRTISGVIAAYTGIAGIQKAIGFIKNTTSLYDTQLNGEVQLLSVLANSLDEETVAKYAVDVDVSADTTDAVNQINSIQDNVTGVEVPVSAKTDALMDAYNQIADKATEIQGKGIYGDEAMIAAGAEFATYFTDTDAITKMMDTLSDYAMGMSGGGALDSTALVDYATGLGKIMTGAYDAMNEKGFEFSDTQKAIINGTATQAQIVQTLGAEYADASSDMQAAATISQVIEESWAGLYENMSQTPEGKIIQLTNAWGDLEEELGGILYPAVLDFLNLFTENWDEVSEFCTMFANGLAILVELATQLVNGALLVASAFQDNWGWIAPIVWGIVAAFTAYQIALGVVNGIQAIHNAQLGWTAVQAYKAAAANTTLAAAEQAKAMAAAAATAAQYGFNAALLACPVTWIVAAVLALIVILYALVGIINQVAGTSISATGLITGAVAVAGAFILNIGIGLYNSFVAVIAAFVNFFIGIIEWVLNAANGGFNSFGDAVANLIGQIISWFLSLGQIVTTIIDAIFGTDWTAGLEGLKNSVTQWGKNENAITLDRMDTSTAGLQRFDYGDAASAGYDFGAGLESKVGNLFNFSGSIPSVEDYASLIADNANLSTLPDIADNTGKIKDTLSDTDEDLKYLRDMAEMEVINRFTTAEVKVDMSGMQNNISNGMDLDGVTSALTDGIMEAIDVVTEGVHD